MEYKRFEDMPVWQLAKQIAVDIYRLLSRIETRKNMVVIDQMQRSALSLSANIAEGFERRTTKEFIQFLGIAKGSAGELRSHLIIAIEIGLLKSVDVDPVLADCENLSKQLKGFMKYLERECR